eukprot:TRINITY_DN13524_c0_g1_i1.p1 TRINITY_DN13524_c0_g1~~TRINITY_DN13524_c0_g1_i1.p1  ORF type:complete len:506 (-),score=75.88 TRINITY_DN13524_c0_g1_i1:237-1754(-)
MLRALIGTGLPVGTNSSMQLAQMLWHGSQLFHSISSVQQQQEVVPQSPPEQLNAFTIQPSLTDALTPSAIVDRLDRFIVGQNSAKKAVAVALRNRWRRHKVEKPLQEEIMPKNILMIGPTGCGKTEIARRLAKIADAPFVKVEATKFTEVGFHGRDVDQIIRDLMDNAIILTKQKLKQQVMPEIQKAVEEYMLREIAGEGLDPRGKERFRDLLRRGQLEEREIKVEIPNQQSGRFAVDNTSGMPNVQEFVVRIDKMMGGRQKGEQRKMKVKDARPLIEEIETERLLNQDMVVREAVHSVENDGIVFIDEIDKIVVDSSVRYGADASSEGVQRDLLPIIEGSTVNTKYGNINTDFILFICSGAFHSCKPSDMLAELQGRLPIRVELKGLTQQDFYRILTEPENNMIKQHQALLLTEGIELHFTEEAKQEVSRVAEEVNKSVENIGARRLYTVLERIVEDISFFAPERAQEALAQGKDKHVTVIDKEDVIKRVEDLMKREDMSKYIL